MVNPRSLGMGIFTYEFVVLPGKGKGDGNNPAPFISEEVYVQ